MYRLAPRRRFDGARLMTVLVIALVASACGAQSDTTNSADSSSSTDAPAAAAFDSSTTDSPMFTLEVAVQNSIESSPFWVAESRGLFAEQGLDIDFVPVNDASNVISAISDEEARVGVVSATAVLDSPDNSLNSELFLAVYMDGVDVTVPDGRGSLTLVGPVGSPIKTGCDLEGARIGVASETSAAAVAVREMARRVDCDSRLIELVEMTPDEIISALGSGDIAAAATLDPLTTNILRGPNEVIANLDLDLCRQTGPCPLSVAVFDMAWAEANPEIVAAFREAILDTMIWIRANELDYRAELVTCCALTIEDAAEIDVPNFSGDSPYLVPDMARLQAVVDAQRALPELGDETDDTDEATEAVEAVEAVEATDE